MGELETKHGKHSLRDKVDTWCRKCYKLTEHKFSSQTKTTDAIPRGLVGLRSVMLICTKCGDVTRFKEEFEKSNQRDIFRICSPAPPWYKTHGLKGPPHRKPTMEK